jgi:hypothetical protein
MGDPMATQPLAGRVESLEQRVTTLEQTPDKFDLLSGQILQLRDEMHAEFSAVRGEIREGDEETRRVLRKEIRAGDEETRRVLREEIRTGDEETRRVLREEIRAGDERVMENVGVLHEQAIRAVLEAKDETIAFARTLHGEAIAHARALHEEAMSYTRTLHSQAMSRIDEVKDDVMAQARALHEDVISRIALLQNGRPSPPEERR